VRRYLACPALRNPIPGGRMSIAVEAGDAATAADSKTTRSTRRGRWIDHWEPENEQFWEPTGMSISRMNLALSNFPEHLGFAIRGRGRQLLVVDGQHLVLLPRAQEGLCPWPKRGGRQPGSGRRPADRATGDHRRCAGRGREAARAPGASLLCGADMAALDRPC